MPDKDLVARRGNLGLETKQAERKSEEILNPHIEKEFCMEWLNDKIYFPSIRAGRFDLLALTELYDDIKESVTPIISARGTTEADIISFAENWGDYPFLIDSSRFAQDANDALSSTLNIEQDRFSEKRAFFGRVHQTNNRMIPVVGFRNGERSRNSTQFSLEMLQAYGALAIRIENKQDGIASGLAAARSILDAIQDDDIPNIAIILDLWSISAIPSLEAGSVTARVTELVEEYNLQHIITLSTSWPDTRPDRGAIATPDCIDPIWHSAFRSLHSTKDFSVHYGDYAATNPVRDLLDDYAPGVMAQPIPFAGYFVPLYWYQERQGAGGENERYRDIARNLVAQPGFDENLCWGTGEIARIADGRRARAANMSYWNKIRINQHITAMTIFIRDGGLDALENRDDNDLIDPYAD